MRPIWFLYHIKKTGGRTVERHLEETLGDKHVDLKARLHPKGTPANEIVGAIDEAVRAEIVTVGGHILDRELIEFFPDRELHETIMIRDPASRTISQINHQATIQMEKGKRPPVLERWLNALGPNHQTDHIRRCLGLPGNTPVQTVIDEISAFDYVIATEQIDECIPTLFEAMGLSPEVPARHNVTGRDMVCYVEPDPELLDQLRERNPDDVALHAAAVELSSAIPRQP